MELVSGWLDGAKIKASHDTTRQECPMAVYGAGLDSVIGDARGGERCEIATTQGSLGILTPMSPMVLASGYIRAQRKVEL